MREEERTEEGLREGEMGERERRVMMILIAVWASYDHTRRGSSNDTESPPTTFLSRRVFIRVHFLEELSLHL